MTVGLNLRLGVSMSMRRLGFAGLSFLAAVGCFAQMAKAETQTFTYPAYDEHMLDWCFTWGADCGQHPADAWCKLKGFDGAQSFKIWEDLTSNVTKLIGTNQTCGAGNSGQKGCDSYTEITCVSADKADVEEVTFQRPKLKGKRLDWCLTWGSSCGKPAADAYCELKGYDNAVTFRIAENIGHTRIISSKQICEDQTCDGFNNITCEKR